MFVYQLTLNKGLCAKVKTLILTDLYFAFRQTIRIEDSKSSLACLIVHDDNDWLKSRLNKVFQLLNILMPQAMKPHKSGKKSANFKSIHFDIWNRYHEKVFFTQCFLSIRC